MVMFRCCVHSKEPCSQPEARMLSVAMPSPVNGKGLLKVSSNTCQRLSWWKPVLKMTQGLTYRKWPSDLHMEEQDKVRDKNDFIHL